MKYPLPTAMALAIAAVLYAGKSDAAQGGHTERVPAGFESLLLGQDEQVEVTILGTTLGLYMAQVKPNTLQFLQPELITAALQQQEKIRPEYADALLAALTMPLARNGHLFCQSEAQAGCGFIESDSVAIIFDESRNAIDLFVNPAWLAARSTASRYYQAAQSRNAFIQSQTLNWSSSRTMHNASLNATSTLGLGEGRYLAANWQAIAATSAARTQTNLQLQDLWLRQDIGKSHYVQAGRLDQRNLASPLGGSFNFSLLPMPQFDGVRLGTTQAWLNQAVARKEDATPLTVVLNRPARIDLYRGEQLLGTQYFTAGLQELNSDSFPDGSYLVQLRIFENGVLVRGEEIPFSKAAGNSRATGHEWFVQAGRVSERQSEATPAWQMGVRARFLRSMTLTSGFSSLGDKLYNESRIDWQGALGDSTLSASAALLQGSDGVRGHSRQIGYHNGISFNLYQYQQRGSQCQGRQGWDSLSCGDSVSASLSTQLAGWTALAGYTRSESRSFHLSEPSDLYAPPHRRDNEKSRQQSSQLSLSRAFIWGDLSLNGRFGVYQAKQDNHQSDRGAFMGISIGHVMRSSSSSRRSNQSRASMEYRSSGSGGPQHYWNASHSESESVDHFREVTVGIGGSQQGYGYASLGGRFDSRYGNVSSTLTQNQGKASATSFTGTYSSSLVTTGNDFWLGGGNGTGTASGATLVQVEGPQEHYRGAAVEVHGNGRPLALGFGESTVLLNGGYQQAQTDLRERVDNSNPLFATLGSGAGRKENFVPPGRLVTRKVTGKVTWTWVGQALANGKGISQGQVLNSAWGQLDHHGGFVLETDNALKTLYVMQESQIFACPLKVRETREVLRMVGQTHCEEIAIGALPEQLQKHQRLAHLQQAFHR
ncbi:TcfC E-set like domain-containing protein [Duffyella gerundensis]|uniref:TcfC E-set like domain-containing protein n=1 Tax=Duffyella TaxID=3026546 RepID=UPI003F6DD114